jgi:hypothetical protein
MWSRRLFLKGNSVKVEPKEVVMVFDGSPNYVKLEVVMRFGGK